MRQAANAVRHGLAVAALALALGAGPAKADSTIKLAAEADLKSIDPIWTTASVTASHGFLVYDQLFAEDSKLVVKPMMIDSWKASADGLTWSFTLRPGLKWHDGSPVTAKDVAPSVKRWGARIAAGQLLMTRVADVAATGELSFEIRLKDKFGPVVQMLGASAQPLFVMPEKQAMTDPFQQIAEPVGSGPFVFVKEDWVPGSKMAYRKFADYKPRAEAPDGYTGAKVVKVDRVEWTVIPDPATAVQALIKGEVDVYQYPTADFYDMLEKSPNITIKIANKFGYNAIMRPNHLVPWTNNPKIRQAMLYAMDQQQSLDAMIGKRDLEEVCWAVFICGTPLETKAGIGPWAKPGPDNIAKAKQLLAEAGYKGEPLVMMDPAADQPVISAMTKMSAQLLKNAGFNIDLQSMDWAALVTRRSVKDDPATNRAGWHFFHTWGTGALGANPLTNNTVATPCDGKNWFGWPCDEKLNAMQQEFITAGSIDQQKEIADRLDGRARSRRIGL